MQTKILNLLMSY